MQVKIIFRLSFLSTFGWRRTERALFPVARHAPMTTIPENRKLVLTGTWVVHYPQGTWECPCTLLQNLAAEAMQGFDKSPAGGVETGGVLYGVRTGRHVQVMTNRPVACEHRNGPAFTLSEKDKTGLDALLGETIEGAPELTPVGWYHTAYRELTPAPGTGTLLDCWFPDPGQPVLVLRRERGEPVQAGFFSRDTKGVLGLEPVKEITVAAMESPSRFLLAKRGVASAGFDGGSIADSRDGAATTKTA